MSHPRGIVRRFDTTTQECIHVPHRDPQMRASRRGSVAARRAGRFGVAGAADRQVGQLSERLQHQRRLLQTRRKGPCGVGETRILPERLFNERCLLSGGHTGAAGGAEDRLGLPVRLVEQRGLLPAQSLSGGWGGRKAVASRHVRMKTNERQIMDGSCPCDRLHRHLDWEGVRLIHRSIHLVYIA